MSTKEKLDNIEKVLNIWNRNEIKIRSLVLYLKSKFYRVDLKKITKFEKEIISKFYDSILEEYTLSYVSIAETDQTYPIVLKLIKRNILKEQTLLEKIDNYDGHGVNYKLTNRAWKKLNKEYKKIALSYFCYLSKKSSIFLSNMIDIL